MKRIDQKTTFLREIGCNRTFLYKDQVLLNTFFKFIRKLSRNPLWIGGSPARYSGKNDPVSFRIRALFNEFIPAILCLVLKVIYKRISFQTPYGPIINNFKWYYQIPIIKQIYGFWLVLRLCMEYRHQRKNTKLDVGSVSGSQQLSEMRLHFKIQELQCYSRILTIISIFFTTYHYHNQCITPLE